MRSLPSALIRMVAIAVAGVVLVLLVLRLTGQIGMFRVPTSNMASFINPGDTIIVQALTLHGQPLQRGDVLTFSTEGIKAIAGPDEAPVIYVKRVAGLPGDTLQIVDDVLRINDRPASEYYNTSQIKYVPLERHSGSTDLSKPYTVPADHLFMLGDNSINSSDSRVWGALPMQNVRHRYWFHLKRAAIQNEVGQAH